MIDIGAIFKNKRLDTENQIREENINAPKTDMGKNITKRQSNFELLRIPEA